MKVLGKMLVGSIEHCGLPDLNINELTVRVDTGAKTSSLHVDNLEEFSKGEEQWVRFDIHPDIYNVEQVVRREAKVLATKKIKSSNAINEQRYIISTLITLGGEQWQIKLSLTDRSDMTYLMLLGREAMTGRVLVDPDKKFLLQEKNSQQNS